MKTKLPFRPQNSLRSGLFALGVFAVCLCTARAWGASTQFFSIESESGAIATASSLSDVSASNGQAIRFVAASNQKPDATNTGVPAGTSLTVINGDQVYATDGMVIDGKDIHGYVQITGKNITIKNSIIRGGTKPCSSGNAQNSAPLWVREDAGATNFVFQDSEIAPSNATACMDGIWASNATIIRANVHGAVDGIKAYDNVTVQDSYIHDLAYFSSDPNQGGGETHNDGLQSYECNSNVLVVHNNVDLSTMLSANAAYQITQDAGVACSNIVIRDNWLDGGGCTLNIAHKVLGTLTGVSVTGNRFGHNQGFSGCTVLLSTKSTLAAYSGNVWDDTGQAVPAPQVHD